MKFVIVAVFLIVIALNSNAQSNMLGRSEREIEKSMDDTSKRLQIFKGPNVYDGKESVQYMDFHGTSMLYFFDNDKCNYIRIVYHNSFLPDIVALMNKENIRSNDSTWTSKNLRYKVNLYTQVPSKNCFYLEFTEL